MPFERIRTGGATHISDFDHTMGVRLCLATILLERKILQRCQPLLDLLQGLLDVAILRQARSAPEHTHQGAADFDILATLERSQHAIDDK